MRNVRQAVLPWTAAAVVTLFCIASVASYRSGARAERVMAMEYVRNGLAALNEPASDPRHRVPRYHEALVAADVALVRAIRAIPIDNLSIQRLAAVRWELSALGGDADEASVTALIELAAMRASHVPEVQADIGSLLYKMGEPTRASTFMARAVTLSPSYARRVVGAMMANGVDPAEIADTLPHTPDVVVSLEDPLVRSGLAAKFLAIAEPSLESAPLKLIRPFSETSRRLGRSIELVDRLTRLKLPAGSTTEALRRSELALTLLSEGDVSGALREANVARPLANDDAAVLERLGDVNFESAEPGVALVDYHRALTIIASQRDSERVLARLYRKIGQAEEKAGHPDKAFDAYRIAVELNADDEFCRARLEAMEDAAGFGRSGRLGISSGTVGD